MSSFRSAKGDNGLKLVAVSGQSDRDFRRVVFVQHMGATQVTLTLVGHSRGQVARAGMTVLDLAVGSYAKALFRAFVCLLLGHLRTLPAGWLKQILWNSAL